LRLRKKDGGVVQIFGASKIAAPYNAVCSNFVVGHSVYDVPFAIFKNFFKKLKLFCSHKTYINER